MNDDGAAWGTDLSLEGKFRSPVHDAWADQVESDVGSPIRRQGGAAPEAISDAISLSAYEGEDPASFTAQPHTSPGDTKENDVLERASALLQDPLLRGLAKMVGLGFLLFLALAAKQTLYWSAFLVFTSFSLGQRHRSITYRGSCGRGSSIVPGHGQGARGS